MSQKKEMVRVILIERKWAMPSKNTFLIKPITELLIEEITEGLWLDPFANNSTIRTIIPDVNFVTNDLNPEFDTDFNMDAIDFLKMFDDQSIDGVVLDFPFSPRQVAESYKHFGYKVTQETTRSSWWANQKKEVSRIIKKEGKAITFGWNSGGMGKTNGWEVKRILLVPHGGWHNDTIITVENKIR